MDLVAALPRLYFVRHGETDWNREFRFQGQRDVPLNETGRAQASANGEMLAGIVGDPAAYRFIASPLTRTRQTMELVRAAMGLPAAGYKTDSRLVEVNYGEWEGRTLDELTAERPDEMDRRERDKWNYVPRDGESYSQLSQRFRPFLDELDSPAVVVIHGGIMRCLYFFLEGMDPGDAAGSRIPQDRVYGVVDGRAGWL